MQIVRPDIQSLAIYEAFVVVLVVVLVLDLARTGLAGARCADRISGSSRTLEKKAFEDEDQDDLVAAAPRCASLRLFQVTRDHAPSAPQKDCRPESILLEAPHAL